VPAAALLSYITFRPQLRHRILHRHVRNFEHKSVAEVQITTQFGGGRAGNFELKLATGCLVRYGPTLITEEMNGGLRSWREMV
jgi:hypothetical protein